MLEKTNEVNCLKKVSDTDLINWLQKQTTGYGKGWICRMSTTGRGWRLHETSQEGASSTIREAIKEAIKLDNE